MKIIESYVKSDHPEADEELYFITHRDNFRHIIKNGLPVDEFCDAELLTQCGVFEIERICLNLLSIAPEEAEILTVHGIPYYLIKTYQIDDFTEDSQCLVKLSKDLKYKVLHFASYTTIKNFINESNKSF